MKTYPSAVDKWLAAILIGAPLAVVAFGIYLCAANASAKTGVIMIIYGMFLGTLITLLTIPCAYTLDDEQLAIKCGLVRCKVPLSKIRQVEKSRALWSAPALSLNRVKITTDTGQNYLVSPKARDAFIADVLARIN